MHASKLEILNADCPESRTSYERSLFQAFQARINHAPSRGLWDWDVQKARLRSRIPYADQLIMVERAQDGTILASLAVSVRCDNGPFEFQRLGFASIDRPHDCCEILIFAAPYKADVRQRIGLWSEINIALCTRGFRFAYATSPDKPLRTYQLFGGVVQVSRGEGCDKRHLLRFDLAPKGASGLPRLSRKS